MGLFSSSDPSENKVQYSPHEPKAKLQKPVIKVADQQRLKYWIIQTSIGDDVDYILKACDTAIRHDANAYLRSYGYCDLTELVRWQQAMIMTQEVMGEMSKSGKPSAQPQKRLEAWVRNLHDSLATMYHGLSERDRAFVPQIAHRLGMGTVIKFEELVNNQGAMEEVMVQYLAHERNKVSRPLEGMEASQWFARTVIETYRTFLLVAWYSHKHGEEMMFQSVEDTAINEGLPPISSAALPQARRDALANRFGSSQQSDSQSDVMSIREQSKRSENLRRLGRKLEPGTNSLAQLATVPYTFMNAG